MSIPPSSSSPDHRLLCTRAPQRLRNPRRRSLRPATRARRNAKARSAHHLIQDVCEISNVKSLSTAPQATSEFSPPSFCTIGGCKSGLDSLQADSSSSPGCGLTCPSSSPGSFPSCARAALNHPWAHLVRPRNLRLQDLQPEQITADLPDELYRQIPLSGYLSAKFCRSLFPRETLSNGVVPENLSCIEIPSLEDAVLFREAADTLIQSAFEGALQPLPRPPRDKLSPKGIWSPRLLPQVHFGRRPVLYQVVALMSNALVLEAKDFFVFLPDHRELHCILLDKFALNLESGSYGFDRGVVSIRDLVWVYELIPIAAVLNDPQAELKRARISRMTALDPQEDDVLKAITRRKISCAVRFSEPPISDEARDVLCQYVRLFFPADAP
ncbi:unnamed protein product [Nippostrongylus brasiliensis]|uniref:Uncharacterized protein n=1 Tax=Nippostrongylus brasiliensis TaxID=27835 RepID=A0A0N4XPL2_NIPBR|nr:unnamed protein product [Nippostrongylus brasiliensis]